MTEDRVGRRAHRKTAGICINSDIQRRPSEASILLVEDHSESLQLLAELIRSGGHIVHTADGYQAALDVAKRERLDLAVCDIGLWDGDGCDLLGELQKLQQLKAIALTGFALAEEVERYRDAGFAAVLRKPLKPSEMAFAIAQLRSAQSNDPKGRNVEPTATFDSAVKEAQRVRPPLINQ